MCSRGRELGRTTIARAAGDNICQMAEKWQGKRQPSPCLIAAAASSARVCTPSFVNTCSRWVFTVPREMNNTSPIAGLVSPAAASRTTSNSVGVRLSAAGLTNPAIGERLFISRGTVKTHLLHVFAKLGVHTRAELAAAAIRHGLG